MGVDLKRLNRDLDSSRHPQPATEHRADAGRATTSSSGRILTAEARSHKTVVVALFAALLLAMFAVAFAVFRWRRGEVSPLEASPLDVQNMRISRLTENGKAINATLSPDGRYVVYVLSDEGNQSLWMRQVATESDVQIMPAERVEFYGLTFSADGNFLYVVASGVGANKNSNLSYLYQMPALGGTLRQLIADVDTAISISPDGKRMAFVRGNPAKAESYLVTANLDGGEQKVLATRKHPQNFTGGLFTATEPGLIPPAWSPDGRTIAASMSDNLIGGHFSVGAFSVADGTEKDIYTTSSFVGRLQWMPDGKGLVMILADPITGLRGQLWYVSYPDGKTRRITNDLTNYDSCCISLAKDGGTVAVVQDNYAADVWIAPEGTADRAQQITSGHSVVGASWLENDKIVVQNARGDLVRFDRNGSNSLLLTSDDHTNSRPSGCGDGRHIVFESFRSGDHIWAMDSDGANLTRLTNGKGESFPSCSPDGKWAVYLNTSGALQPWKVSLAGGSPWILSDEFALPFLKISPDGTRIAYLSIESQPIPHWVMSIIGAESGQKLSSTEVSLDTIDFAWAPDGQALDVITTRNSVSNLFRRPLTGGPAKQVTNFKSGRIFSAAWSPDGKQLALARGQTSADVVLITSSK